jgi:hypothetical protein
MPSFSRLARMLLSLENRCFLVFLTQKREDLREMSADDASLTSITKGARLC